MPKNVQIKYRSGEAVEAILENSMVKDPSIVVDQEFNETDTSMVITNITIEGNLKGFPSPLVISVGNGDCTVTVEYDEPAP